MDTTSLNTVSFHDLFRNTFPVANHFKDFSEGCKHLIETKLQQKAPRGSLLPAFNHSLPEMKYVDSYTGELQTILKDIVDEIAIKSISSSISKEDKEFAEELCEATWDKDLK